MTTETVPGPRIRLLPDILGDLEAEAGRAHQQRLTGRTGGPVTGLAPVDIALGGYLAEGLHILHGAPGTGKTALVLQIAANCGPDDANALVASMSRDTASAWAATTTASRRVAIPDATSSRASLRYSSLPDDDNHEGAGGSPTGATPLARAITTERVPPPARQPPLPGISVRVPSKLQCQEAGQRCD